MNRALVFGLVLVSSLAPAEGAPKVTHIDAPKKMLFIGNSFTYFNQGVPYHLLRLAKAADPANAAAYTYEMATISSATLSDLEVLMPRVKLKWDVVVLQDRSREPIDSSESAAKFRASARAFDQVIREAGAKSVLYMTWAFRDQPEMTHLLSSAYVAAGDELNALVVPVGLAFERSRKKEPALDLYDVDGFHPNLSGTYLAACVFYAAMFGKSAEGNDYFAAGLDSETARKLQKTAWETVREFYGRSGDSPHNSP